MSMSEPVGIANLPNQRYVHPDMVLLSSCEYLDVLKLSFWFILILIVADANEHETSYFNDDMLIHPFTKY